MQLKPWQSLFESNETLSQSAEGFFFFCPSFSYGLAVPCFGRVGGREQEVEVEGSVKGFLANRC